ncbi:MAG: multi-sensor hybrid histidine kinase [Planctomycetota bacterium]|nr:multi-sensor hybrid histidine kinase [Planctomycetota bacterium]
MVEASGRMKLSPEDFHSLFATAPGPVVLLDPDFTIVALNDALLRATMSTREAVTGKNVFDAFPRDPDDGSTFASPDLRASLDKVIATGAPDRMPTTRCDIRRSEGEGGAREERYWDAWNRPLLDSEGRVTQIIHQFEDVTELVRLRRRDEEHAAELEEANGVYRAICDQGIFAGRIDLEGRVTDANRSCLDPCGYAREDVIGKRFWECGWWNRSPGVQEFAKRAFDVAAVGQAFRGESTYFWSDGTERLVELACMPIKDDSGNVRFVVATGIDVTERSGAERDRRATEVLESITDAFFALDRDWRFTYVNRQAEQTLGHSPGNLNGKVIWEEYPGLARSQFERAYRLAMSEGQSTSFTSYYPDHDRWYDVNAYPGADGISVYFRDVTARKRTEEEVSRLTAASEEQRRVYEVALSNTPDLVYVFGLDHRFLYTNEALLNIWGRTAEESIGKNCLELGYEPALAERHGREIDQIAATGKPIRGEVAYTGTAGRRMYDYIMAPVIGACGEVVAVAGTTRDVTDRREADEALRRSEERFRLAQQAANVGTYDWDLVTNEVIWSDGVFESVGLVPGSVPPTMDLWMEFLHPDDQEGSSSVVREAIDSGKGYYHEFRVVLRTGEVRWLASTGRAILGEGGIPARFLGVNVDITQRKATEEAAREHEERFRQVADNLPGGAIYQAVAGPTEGTVRFSYISRGVERLFGFTQEEVALDGSLLFGLVHEADAASVRAANEASRRDSAPFDLQFRSYTRDGTMKWVHARSAPRPAPAGGLVWDGVVIDVTAQKLAEHRQALLAEAGRILGSSLDYERTLAEVCRLVVPDLADWCTLDLLSEAGEPRRVEVAHVDPAKVALAHEHRRRYPPDPADERGLMKVLKTGLPDLYEEITDELLRLGARDEEHYEILRELGLKSVMIVPLIARGRTLGALSLVTAESSRRYGPDDLQVASEIAARAALAVDNARLFRDAEEAARHREEALALHKEVEEQLTLLVQASGSLSASLEPAAVLDAVVSLSRDLIRADAYAVWRYDAGTGRWGISVASGLSDEYCKSTIQVLEKTPSLPEAPVMVEDVLRSEFLAGRRIGYEREGVKSILAVPLKVRGEANGTITFYCREPHGFTEVEIRVATALSNLASAAIGTSELYEALKENDRRKDEFLAMLAHELRNPLSAIGNAVQLMRRSLAHEHIEWAKDVIHKQVRSLSRMIDDLLDVSRITRRKIKLQKQTLEVPPVVSHAAETVRPLIEERGHMLVISHSSTPMWIEADPHRLEQVLVNLLNNAAKYTDSGGNITISTMPDGDSVAITVTDNGNGIPPEKIPQMFELFAQGDRSIARSEGGLGIGLTLVKSLVEMHDGSVTARSEGLGKGSEFTVRFPAVRPPKVEIRAESPKQTGRPGKGSRVLVVDDNEDTARGLVKLLKILGHEVETAFDGPSAIELAQSQRPEFVLLDIGLPGMDGYQVAERLRAGGFADTVIIAVSGYGEEAARKRSLEAGINHHLVKPVDYDRVVELIRGTR